MNQPPMTHIFAWKNNAKRLLLYRRRCRVIGRLALNSAIVEFEDGQRECVSRNALRRIEGDMACPPHLWVRDKGGNGFHCIYCKTPRG